MLVPFSFRSFTLIIRSFSKYIQLVEEDFEEKMMEAIRQSEAMLSKEHERRLLLKSEEEN